MKLKDTDLKEGMIFEDVKTGYLTKLLKRKDERTWYSIMSWNGGKTWNSSFGQYKIIESILHHVNTTKLMRVMEAQ